MLKFKRWEAYPVVRGIFELVNAQKPELYSVEFICNFQTALLLSLLEKGLLTQQQFERCAEQMQKRSG